MTNFVISYADIPFRAAYMQSGYGASFTVAEDYDWWPRWNTINGPRHNWYRSGTSSSVGHWLKYGLTSGTTSTVDHLLVARADYIHAKSPTIEYTVAVARSSDNVTYTEETSTPDISSYNLLGPRAEDFIIEIPLTSAYRYWRLEFVLSSASDFRCSKIHLGTFFDFAKEPVEYKPERIPASQSSWIASSGAQYLLRLDEPIYKLDVVWDGITDDLTTSFINKIVRYRHINPVFLYTRYKHAILDNQQLLHCQLTDFKTSQDKKIKDYNRIECTFEELIG